MNKIIDLLGGKKITIEENVNTISLTFSCLFVKNADYKFEELYYEDLIKFATELLKSAEDIK